MEIEILAERIQQNIDKSNATEMRQWIYDVKEMNKKVKKLLRGNIRECFN